MGKGNKKERKEEPQHKVIKDSRFSSVHNDPRFNLPSLGNVKVKVDDRFSKKELSKLNQGATGKKVKIDRYGRKLKDSDSNKDFDKYYKEEGSSSDEASEVTGDESEEDANSDESEEEVDIEGEELDAETADAGFVDRARGEGLVSSSEDDSSSGLDTDSESESEIESEIELEEGKPDEGDPSDSFAVVNMDWDNLRAVDLMATFLSFVPTGGALKSISIYPSEFGQEQMQKEEIEGPPRELFKSKKKVESDSDESDSEIDLKNKDDLEKAARKLYQEDDGEEDYDSKALRRYQLQRLRYYYAVVRCDSISTAKNIYDNCDGTEYESTANIFDLRYIPEGMDFNDSEAKDMCTKIPSNYKPNSTFVTDALQHSKVKLTWDETPKERLDIASRQFSQKEIDEMDFKAYLASDSDASENETINNDMKNKYQSLLGKGFNKEDGEDEEGDVDMEITFNPALNDNEAKPQPEEEQEESTIAAYKRKEKERRKRRMEKFKQTQEDEQPEQKEDKSHAKTSKKSKDKPTPIDDKKTAQLELLMMEEEDDDKASAQHFNMKDVIKLEKQANRKSKKNKKNIDKEMTQDDFLADLNDPRFKEIFENHEYAIDPTSSEFKKTKTMKKILEERSKRKNDVPSGRDAKKHKKQTANASGSNELGSLVDKLKRKHNKK